MSAKACLVFFGVRMRVREEDVPALNEGRHAHQNHAREARLSFYWADFGYDSPDFYTFVGTKLAIVGPEVDRVGWTGDALGRTFRETSEKLRSAGFEKHPELYIQWCPKPRNWPLADTTPP